MWGNPRGRGETYRKIWCKGSEEEAEEGTHPGRYHKAEPVEEGERTQETGKVELHNRRQLDHTHLPERQEGKLGRNDKAYAEIHKAASDQIPEIWLDLKVYLEATDRKEGCNPHPYPLKCRIKYRDPDRKDGQGTLDTWESEHESGIRPEERRSGRVHSNTLTGMGTGKGKSISSVQKLDPQGSVQKRNKKTFPDRQRWSSQRTQSPQRLLCGSGFHQKRDQSSDRIRVPPLHTCEDRQEDLKMDQKMARVDISLIVSDKSARIKKGRCVYIIASRDFPKGPGNPISGREEAEDTTPHRLVMLGLIAALKRIHRPSLITIHTTCQYLANGHKNLNVWKTNGWKRSGDRELKNADLWQEIDKQLSGHAVRFQTEF